MDDVTYSLSKWPALGYEGDAAYIDVIKIREFGVEFGDDDAQLLKRYFNETRDRLTAMKDFSRINVYVSDPEVQKHTMQHVHSLIAVMLLLLFTFCVSRRRRKMYCGHARLCVCLSVCLSVRGRTPTLLHAPGCNLAAR